MRNVTLRSRHVGFLFLFLAFAASAQPLPPAVAHQLPLGFKVMAVSSGDFNGDGKSDYVVVVHNTEEKALASERGPTPRRPLLAFIQRENGKYSLVGRNDEIVFAVDEGGQCDPFLENGDGLAVKGGYFTVQNQVACGSHWTDFITFKYSKQLQNFVFHKRIVEAWEPLEQNSNGHRSVDLANKTLPVLLQDFHLKQR